MNRVFVIAALGCIAPAMAAEPAGNPEQIEFQRHFQPGRTVRQKLVTKTVGDMPFLGSMKMQQTFEQVLTTRCRKVNPDKSAVFEVTLSDIVLHQSMGPITIDFDSRTWQPGQAAGSPVDLVGKLFSAMNGATFTVTVSETGQAQKVEGLTAMMKKAIARLGDDQEARVVKQLFEQLSSAMGDDMMSQQFQDFGRMCPPKKGPVKIGETWEHTWSMKFPIFSGSMEGKGEYELLGVEVVSGRPCAKVRARETFSLVPAERQPAGDSPLAGILGRMKLELSSSGGNGIAYIDYEHGDVVRSRQTQNLELKVSVAPDPDDPQEETRLGVQAMTIKFRTSTSLELLPGEGEPESVGAARMPAGSAEKPGGPRPGAPK